MAVRMRKVLARPRIGLLVLLLLWFIVIPHSCSLFLYINHTQPTIRRPIRPDEGLTLETSAFESVYGGHFTLSTQLIKPNYLVHISVPSNHLSKAKYHSLCEL